MIGLCRSAVWVNGFVCVCQLVQAAEGKFNPHIHVEYEWSLRLEEMDESDDDLDDKVWARRRI